MGQCALKAGDASAARKYGKIPSGWEKRREKCVRRLCCWMHVPFFLPCLNGGNGPDRLQTGEVRLKRAKPRGDSGCLQRAQSQKGEKRRPGLFKQGLGEFSHTASFTKSKKDVQVIGGIVRFRYGAAKVIFA